MTILKKPPANRTVAALTPLIFAPLAGAISVAAAQIAPGVNIDQEALTAVFIAGATIALGGAAQWTKGWQAQEHQAAMSPAPAVDDEIDELDDGEAFADDLHADIDDEIGADIDDEIGAAADVEAFHADDELEPDFELDDEDEDHELMALMSAPKE